MNTVNITKEAALARLKKALQHKQEIQRSIEQEFAAVGKKADVVFL